MNINDAKKLIKLGYKTKRGVILLSGPGLGKSSAIMQCTDELAKEYDEPFGMIEMRGSSLNPSESGDISYISRGKVAQAPQSWVPSNESVKKGDHPARGLIFLDEIADSMMAIQSILQRLFLDRKLGSVTLADGWQCVAASNRAADKAASGRLSTALINRCAVVTVEPDVDAYYDWGLENGIDYRILSYVRWMPASLSDFDPSRRSDNPAFCSPRSLEIASDSLKEMDGFDEALKLEILSGIIGDGRGSELHGFIRIIEDLPNLDDLIKNPEKYPVSEKVDVNWATIGALIEKANKKNLTNILKYFVRFDTELSVVAVKDIAKRHEAVFETEVFSTWASDKVQFVV